MQPIKINAQLAILIIAIAVLLAAVLFVAIAYVSSLVGIWVCPNDPTSCKGSTVEWFDALGSWFSGFGTIAAIYFALMPWRAERAEKRRAFLIEHLPEIENLMRISTRAFLTLYVNSP